jgi:SAM-dependent methyltransferase
MSVIADSKANLETRTWNQHQAVLTVMQTILDNPQVTQFRWLDLACGRGQIIHYLDKNIEEAKRRIIHYSGYDIKLEYTKATQERAATLALASAKVEVGSLERFPDIIKQDQQFDLITFINTAHEVNPGTLAMIIAESLARLADEGVSYIYDMDRLPKDELELGAIPWSRNEIQQLVPVLAETLGSEYKPSVGQWVHGSCNGWNLTIQRKYLGVCGEVVAAKKDELRAALARKLDELVKAKFSLCKQSLESLTQFGAENATEEEDKLRLLYVLWGLIRVMGGGQ